MPLRSRGLLVDGPRGGWRSSSGGRVPCPTPTCSESPSSSPVPRPRRGAITATRQPYRRREPDLIAATLVDRRAGDGSTSGGQGGPPMTCARAGRARTPPRCRGEPGAIALGGSGDRRDRDRRRRVRAFFPALPWSAPATPDRLRSPGTPARPPCWRSRTRRRPLYVVPNSALRRSSWSARGPRAAMAQPGLGGSSEPAVRLASAGQGGKDAGRPNSSAIWPTEDAAPRSVRRARRARGFARPPSRAQAARRLRGGDDGSGSARWTRRRTFAPGSTSPRSAVSALTTSSGRTPR